MQISYQMLNYKHYQYTKPELNITGIPRGSVLDPLVFIIFMDDIIPSAGNSKTPLFANDTALAVSAPLPQEFEI